MAPPSRQPPDVTRLESIERRQQSRGLVVIALLVLLGSLLRFGLDRVFTPGWWRLW